MSASRTINVTVTQLPNTPNQLAAAWPALVAHVAEHNSDLVLLPEMIFSAWLAATDQVSADAWQAAIDSHTAWIGRLEALAPAAVLGTRPVIDADSGERFNEGYLWDIEAGLHSAHRKRFLPDEPGFWEATWYQRGPADFQVRTINDLNVGFMICTELWFTEHARGYAKQGAHFIVNPRATEAASVDKWLVGGRAAAVMAGAYSLSSNHSGATPSPDGDVRFGGAGWIIDPNGEVLAITSDHEPFVTLALDLAKADAAKSTYPRDVIE